MGKGLTEVHSLHTKLVPDCSFGNHKPTSLRGIAMLGSSIVRLRKRVSLRSPVRENCTPGSGWGARGDPCPYHDDPATGEAGEEAGAALNSVNH